MMLFYADGEPIENGHEVTLKQNTRSPIYRVVAIHPQIERVVIAHISSSGIRRDLDVSSRWITRVMDIDEDGNVIDTPPCGPGMDSRSHFPHNPYPRFTPRF